MILLTTDDTVNGGIAKFCRVLENKLDFRKILFFSKKPVSFNKHNQIKFKFIGISPIYFFNFIKLYKNINKREKVIINDPQCSTITLFLLFFIRLFKDIDLYFISHGFMFHNNSNSIIKKYYFKLLTKIVFPNLTLISVSDNDSKILESFNYKENYKINHGFYFKDEDNKTYREYTYCYIARDVPHKNIDLYIAFCKKQHSITKKKNILISDTKRFKDCEDFLEIKTNLSDNEVSKLLKHSEYFVSFSTYEGFGMAALEAVGLGCKPLLFSNESFSKIFNDFKWVTFDKLSIESAQEAFNSYQHEEIKKLFKSMKNKYSQDTMINKYKSILIKKD